MGLLVEVKNLSVDFDGKLVLDDISFDIEEGEVIGILGKSGAGKTVLMHILRGTERIGNVNGSVIYHVAMCEKCDYVDVPSKVGSKCKCGGKMEPLSVDFAKVGLFDEKRKAVTKRVSIMIQRTFALYGDDSVLTNILNSLSDVDYKGGNDIEIAVKILDEVNMTHRTMHIARDLSGGEKQRVVLARQLVRNPFLLLADEPTGTLDQINADIVHNVIMESVKSHKMAMVITSHWPDVIAKMSNKAILLDEGKILDIGDPDTIVKKFLEESDTTFVEKPESFGEDIIRVKDLTKRFVSVERGVVRAVDGITFDVKEREIFGLVGPSGSGKTTTSEILMGVMPPTSGEVEVRVGDEWIDMKKPGYMNKGRATKYMGILHQEYGLYPHSRIIENLTESISLDLPYELGIRKAINTLKVAGFSESKAKSILNKNTYELSEGERHRVALAQVLMKEPKIVIMDEPTGTMDPITCHSVTNSILNARNELGETFIIVSHDMDFVTNICDRVALMSKGKIVKIGTPEEVVSEPMDRELASYDDGRAIKLDAEQIPDTSNVDGEIKNDDMTCT
ncbi:MAG: methyl coenzyme M reductase system, component A2 [Methanosarcinaceae archaeon]|nr:methyl coenzyme M reductase system, component A2 [Methanosarcinaceae archaeon]